MYKIHKVGDDPIPPLIPQKDTGCLIKIRAINWINGSVNCTYVSTFMVSVTLLRRLSMNLILFLWKN